jgi:tRNA-specific 2-thiouridylase
MSGGVDSSTALHLLKEQGYECIGVSMQLWDYSRRVDVPGAATAGSCCSLDDIYDARAVADGLGVPFYVVNVMEDFSREVVDYFVDGYARGLTPNPCARCNQALKFGVLLRKALLLGADLLATGHYARIAGSGGRQRLLKGVDADKDQSYFLFALGREVLDKVLFPLGRLTKEEVRRYALEKGIKTAGKKDSQEICFVEGPTYSAFISERLSAAPGEIVDETGRVLGTHRGLFNYTIGQRKGLSLSGGPHYVTAIDVAANRLTVGAEASLYCEGLVARDVNWLDPEAADSVAAGRLDGVVAVIRYRHLGVEATVTQVDGRRFCVEFAKAQKAVAPGQAIVFYRGDEVLGGGWIEGRA